MFLGYFCLDFEASTVDENSRFPVLITLPEILHGAMFDFADVAGNSVLEHLIHLLHILSMGDCCLKDT